jgi:hypothetical protein
MTAIGILLAIFVPVCVAVAAIVVSFCRLQRELLTTIPVDDTGELFAEHYGLGLYRVQPSCGTAREASRGLITARSRPYSSRL